MRSVSWVNSVLRQFLPNDPLILYTLLVSYFLYTLTCMSFIAPVLGKIPFGGYKGHTCESVKEVRDKQRVED